MNGGGLKTSEGPDEQARDKNIYKTGQEKDKERPREGASGHEQRQAVGMLSDSVVHSERRQAQTRFPAWTPNFSGATKMFISYLRAT